MHRVSDHIVVAVPAEACQRAVQEAFADERLRAANQRLRGGRAYSGWVTEVKPGRSLRIVYAAYDPLIRERIHALGWQVTYDFLSLADGTTRVEVGIEYGWLAAAAALGLLRAQAVNDISHRLSAMYALEVGCQWTSPPSLPAGAPHAAGASALGAAPPAYAAGAARTPAA